MGAAAIAQVKVSPQLGGGRGWAACQLLSDGVLLEEMDGPVQSRSSAGKSGASGRRNLVLERSLPPCLASLWAQGEQLRDPHILIHYSSCTGPQTVGAEESLNRSLFD